MFGKKTTILWFLSIFEDWICLFGMIFCASWAWLSVMTQYDPCWRAKEMLSRSSITVTMGPTDLYRILSGNAITWRFANNPLPITLWTLRCMSVSTSQTHSWWTGKSFLLTNGYNGEYHAGNVSVFYRTSRGSRYISMVIRWKSWVGLIQQRCMTCPVRFGIVWFGCVISKISIGFESTLHNVEGRVFLNNDDVHLSANIMHYPFSGYQRNRNIESVLSVGRLLTSFLN